MASRPSSSTTSNRVQPTLRPTGIAPSAAAQSGLTPHFEAWLSSHGYGGYDFGRGDVPGGSTGGKTGDGDTVTW